MIAIAVDVPAKCACSGMYCRTFTNGHRKRKPFYNGYLCATANSLQATSLSPSHPCNNRFPVPKVTVRVVESFDCILFNWPINETLSPKRLQTGDSITQENPVTKQRYNHSSSQSHFGLLYRSSRALVPESTLFPLPRSPWFEPCFKIRSCVDALW